jgi:alkanesulfonate monooxygenase
MRDMSTLEFCWVLPGTGDGEHLGTAAAGSPPDLATLLRVALAVEDAAYDLALVPTGFTNNHYGEDVGYLDSVCAASAVIPATERLRLLVAIRTGSVQPAACARMCATMDVLSGGRFMLNAVTGATAATAFGETLDKAERYARTDELLAVLAGLWGRDGFDFVGAHYTASGSVDPKPLQRPRPPIYVAGTSAAAREIAARRADCLLVPGAPLETASAIAADVRARDHGGPRLGTHFYVFTRKTEDEALAAAEEAFSRIDPAVARRLGGSDDEALHRASPEEGNLWYGTRRLWSGASPALVGSYENVAAALNRYVEAGYTTFVLSSFPMEREARRIAEHVLPRVRAGAAGATA